MHFTHHHLAQGVVKGTQHGVLAQNQRDFAAERVHYASKFSSDITCAHDNHPCGFCLKGEEPVTADAKFGPRNAWNSRYAAGGDQNVRGVNFTIFNTKVMWPFKATPTSNRLDACLVKIALIDTVQSQNVGIAGTF